VNFDFLSPRVLHERQTYLKELAFIMLFLLGKKIIIGLIYSGFSFNKCMKDLLTVLIIDGLFSLLEKYTQFTPKEFLHKNDIFMTILKICETVCDSIELEKLIVRNGLDGYTDELAISLFGNTGVPCLIGIVLINPIWTPILMSLYGKELLTFKASFNKALVFASSLVVFNHFISMKNYIFMKEMINFFGLSAIAFNRQVGIRLFISTAYLMRIAYDLIIHGHINFESHFHIKVKRAHEELHGKKIAEVTSSEHKKNQ
jgi:hypothetical protein